MKRFLIFFFLLISIIFSCGFQSVQELEHKSGGYTETELIVSGRVGVMKSDGTVFYEGFYIAPNGNYFPINENALKGEPIPTSTATPAVLIGEALPQTTILTDRDLTDSEQRTLKDSANLFVNAQIIAGVQTSLDEVLKQGFITYDVISIDGKTYEIASPQDRYPLIMKAEKGGWINCTPANLATIKGKLIGITMAGGDETSNEPMYKERAKMFNTIMPPAAFSELYMGKNGNPDRWLGTVKINKQHLIIESLFGKRVPKDVNVNKEYAINRVRSVFQALKDNNIKDFSMELSLEPFSKYGWDTNNPYYKNLGGTNWIVNAYEIMWNVAKEYGLTPGKDFSLIGLTGLVPLKNAGFDSLNSIYLTEAIKIKKQVAQIIDLPEDKVPFDLGGEMFIGKPAATIEDPIPISIFQNEEDYSIKVKAFFDEVYKILGQETEFYVNGIAVNTGNDFALSAELTSTALEGILPFVKSLTFFNPLSIDHLGEDPNTYPQFFPNTLFGKSPNFTIGAPVYALMRSITSLE
ncbi:MAG: hypothetical protein AB9907_06175 [Flexilinea sp.]